MTGEAATPTPPAGTNGDTPATTDTPGDSPPPAPPGPEVDLEAARELIQRHRAERVEQFQKRLQALCKEYGCDLIPRAEAITLPEGGLAIKTRIDIVSTE